MPDDTTSTDQAIRSRLQSIFPNEHVREKVLRIVTEDTSKRPEGWSSSSASPYYKEHYGKEMRELADDQLKTYREIVYDFETFCRPHNRAGCSERTLYNRVNQSRRYVYEKLDVEGKYANWRDITNVEVRAGVGVVIFIIPEILAAIKGDTSEIPKPRMAESRENKPRWKQQLDDWVEADTTDPIVIKNLILDEHEQDIIRNELMGDRRVECIVTCSEIRALKIEPDAV